MAASLVRILIILQFVGIDQRFWSISRVYLDIAKCQMYSKTFANLTKILHDSAFARTFGKCNFLDRQYRGVSALLHYNLHGSGI